MYGKVNHVTNEEVQQAQDVILDMFLASSHPAAILFDWSVAFIHIIKLCGKV
jgi:hypothetical protein